MAKLPLTIFYNGPAFIFRKIFISDYYGLIRIECLMNEHIAKETKLEFMSHLFREFSVKSSKLRKRTGKINYGHKL